MDIEARREQRNAAVRRRRLENPGKVRAAGAAAARKWRAENPERYKEIQRKARAKRSKAATQATREWRAANLEHSRAWHREHVRKVRATPEGRIADRLRTRMWSALKNRTKSGSAVRDLGCSIEYLRGYLAGQFEPGMTWENYGRNGWHIRSHSPPC